MSGHVRLFDPCIALGLKLSTYAEWGLKGFGVGTVWAIWKIIGCLQTQRDHWFTEDSSLHGLGHEISENLSGWYKEES